MGIARLKVSRDFLDEAVHLVERFGKIRLVRYPQGVLDRNCEIEFEAPFAPDGESWLVSGTIRQSVEGSKLTIEVSLERVFERREDQ